MPHCIIEHSDTIDDSKLISLVFDGVMASELFDADGGDIKVRSQSYNMYLVGNKKSNFVHVALKILSGRNDEQKVRLSQLVLYKLKSIGLGDCSITVEVIDIDRVSYSKSAK